MSYQLQFYFLWLPKLRQDFPKECTALKLYFWTKFYATVFVWEIIFSDCVKAQNSVSSGTFLLLFFFTAQWQSPSVFCLSLLHWFLWPYLLEENHRQTMLMVYQIWSCEAICPSIPKFHLAKPTQFLPLLSAPIPSKKKKKKTQHNQLARWTQVSLHVCCLKPQAKFVFHIFLWQIENRFWREYKGRFVFVFSLLNTAVELVVGMCCQFNSESGFSFSWKPHREFFEKSQNFFTVKPGDRENLFTCKSC